MKFPCPCGGQIYDGPDRNPNKGHLVPDQDWFRLLDAIDAAIEGDHPTAKDKEAACMSLRNLISDLSYSIWQCSDCGQIWIDDREHLQQDFIPATEAGKKILQSRVGQAG